jgi:hypothetical protein
MESNPKPAIGALAGRIELTKDVEHMVEPIGRHPNSRVADTHHGLSSVSAHLDLYMASRRSVFEGVVENTREHLVDPAPIGIDAERLGWRNQRDLLPGRLEGWT